jgi:uncharacterized protein
MILIDANLLIYAHVKDFREHPAAKSWLDERLSSDESVGLPWESLLAFARIVSNPKIFSSPEPISEAWLQVEEWLGAPNVWIPKPTDKHAAILREYMRNVVTRSNLVPDAQLAALAVEHRLTVCTTDGDFARFPGLSWETPLAARM